MATRRKAAGKSGRKQKKMPVRKAARKTVRKTKTTSKRTAKKSSPRPAPRKRATSIVRPTSIRPPAGAAPPIRPARSASREQRILVVIHYYSHLSVVAMQLEPGATLRVGDVIHITDTPPISHRGSSRSRLIMRQSLQQVRTMISD
jgi:hypothetical protein